MPRVFTAGSDLDSPPRVFTTGSNVEEPSLMRIRSWRRCRFMNGVGRRLVWSGCFCGGLSPPWTNSALVSFVAACSLSRFGVLISFESEKDLEIGREIESRLAMSKSTILGCLMLVGCWTSRLDDEDGCTIILAGRKIMVVAKRR